MAIEYEKRAGKELAALQTKVRDQVRREIDALDANPFHGAEKVEGSDDLWRVYAGGNKYRVLYKVKDRVVRILRIAKRGEVYRKMSRLN